jgi:hypothetical protein
LNWLVAAGAVAVGLGVDQEKDAAWEDLGGFIPGDAAVEEGMSPQLVSIGLLGWPGDVVDLPLTSRSKSSSVAPLEASN